MPIYQYRCTVCAHDIEVLQKMSDPPIQNCEACPPPQGLGTMEKCIGAHSFRLSGSGYYETDEKPKAKQRHLATSSDSSCPT